MNTNRFRTQPLRVIREEIASFELDFLKAISIRTIVHPLNSGLYLEGKPLGLSTFDKKLYQRELRRALVGSYKNGETPMSSLPLPFAKTPRRGIAQRVKRGYIKTLGELCQNREDNPLTYTKTFEADIDAVYFLWQRITRAGKQVGRTKLIESEGSLRTNYERAIANKDITAITALLRDSKQEEKVVERVREEALACALNPEVLEGLFRRVVMPTTLELEAYDLIENA